MPYCPYWYPFSFQVPHFLYFKYKKNVSKVKIATIWWCWPLLVLKAGVSISNLMKNGDPWLKAKTNFQFITGFRETIQNGDDQTNIMFIHLLSVVLVGTVRGYRVPAVQLVKSENSPGERSAWRGTAAGGSSTQQKTLSGSLSLLSGETLHCLFELQILNLAWNNHHSIYAASLIWWKTDYLE